MDDERLHAEFEAAAGELELTSAGTVEYRRALDRLEGVASAGSVEAAEAVAEAFAIQGPHHDAEKAYRWYYIALAAQGYKTEFRDSNNTPPHYCGPVGDFRNESMVSELVAELGFDRVHELDAEIIAAMQRRAADA